ncbi:amidohydrolase [Anaeropeptidivorans aminofermentans]|jgi:aminobenzoyl-glutamate utilization protein B|uniref:amidohydrolase n=1 Tax=Anaeropeptidivorans aminofermentans TaxID=2934315 RepID=UPI0020240673|nr:amidohydrolase [Anaeropeptidivorans aminofermentans]MBE6011521.1 amidohydrolase [Lachnospiraceae bacterium]
MSLGSIALKAIENSRETLEQASIKIWENPEGPFKEFEACKITAEILKNAGFNVEVGAAGIPTAIKATYGEGHPVIGFLGEYDALPGMSQKLCTEKESAGQSYGHGCGHNLLGTAHVGAVIGMKEEMEQKNLKGTIIFFGCPAEEILVGKGYMAREGAFDDIDLCIHFHPNRLNAVNVGTMNGLNTAKFHFRGKTAHAGGDPHNGRSALDAVEIMNVGANYLREHVTTDVRIHYVITHGGTAPNIVPDYACVWYYVRAPKREVVEDTYKRLIKVAEGAAHMTETKLEVEYLGGCYNTLNNKVLAEVINEALNEAPRDSYTEEEKKFAGELNKATPEVKESLVRKNNIPADMEICDMVLPIQNVDGFGSTDVGDVQHIVPGIMFGTACYGLGAAGHSWQITASSGHSIGRKGMIYASRVMAIAGLKILEDPSIYERAKKEFDEAMAGKEYLCPIPKDLPIPQ